MGLCSSFDPEKVLKIALGRGGEFADIFIEDAVKTNITYEDKKIEKVTTGVDKGCGIRVIAGQKTFYAYTNEITEKALTDLARALAKGVAGGSPGVEIPAMKRQNAGGFAIEQRPSDAGLAEKADLVIRADRAARGFDKRVVQVKALYSDSVRKLAMINSLGQWVEEEKTGLVFFTSAIARDGEVLQTGYEPLGGALGLEAFTETPPEEVGLAAAARAVQMLGAKKAPAGAMAVVLSSEAGGTMIHEAVGHGLEADLALAGLSVYSDRIGEEVASPLITVIDDGTIPFKRGSAFFDEEGTPTQRSVLIENGVLKGYMLDRLSAMKAGGATKSTGNGRRQSYQFKPIPRMTNTMIAPGETRPGEIVSSLEKGLFVKKMGGGQVNTVNGDFVFEVTEGYIIEKGKVADPVRGATITGNGPDILKKIDMVGSDLGFGIGTCGKDAQGVPVADAQPTLRIPEITVGGGI
ncbi:MAG: TldD/PmbA family protein [Thermodesulfobacteriota bacterium]